MTNGDKIRAMTDDELVEFAMDKCECPTKECPKDNEHNWNCTCRNCWASWLEEEADE